MSRKTQGLRTVVIGIGLSVWLLLSLQLLAGTKPNFSGKWQLNLEKSEDPFVKMREAKTGKQADHGPTGGLEGRRGMGRHGGMGGPGGSSGRGGMGGSGGPGGPGGGSGGGPGSGSEPAGENPEAQREPPQERIQKLLDGTEQLTIGHHEPSLTIQNAKEVMRVYTTDGHSVELENAEGDRWESAARWISSNRLGITRKDKHYGNFEQVYELSGDGQELIVTTKVEGSGRAPSFQFRRTYDRIKGE